MSAAARTPRGVDGDANGLAHVACARLYARAADAATRQRPGGKCGSPSLTPELRWYGAVVLEQGNPNAAAEFVKFDFGFLDLVCVRYDRKPEKSIENPHMEEFDCLRVLRFA